MARKKSVRKASERFVDLAERLEEYYVAVSEGTDLLPQEVTWACEAAIIKLNAYFEHLMLNALVGAINNDTTTLTNSTGVPFPKHLTDEVCEYIVTSGRYFDFRGRDGLIKVLKTYVPGNHYLVKTVSKPKYRDTLDKLIALRTSPPTRAARARSEPRSSSGGSLHRANG